MGDEFLPHQIEGSKWLAARQFGCLWDEPGAGKTAQAVRAMDQAQTRRDLVLCPAVVKTNWAKEIDRWSSRKREITIIDGYPKAVPGEGVSIASHASIINLEALRHLFAMPWHSIIIDEAHEFRTSEAQRTMRLYGDPTLDPHQSLAQGLQARSHFLWPATGTPLVNSASDLYPVIRARLGNRIPGNMGWWQYCERYTKLVPDQWDGKKPVGVENASELKAILAGSVLRRTLHGVGINLPELTLQPGILDVPHSDMIQVMAALEGWSPERLELALETQDELRDAAISRTRHVVGLAKANGIAAHLAHLMQRGLAPVVCFYQHTDVMQAVRAHPYLTGLSMATIQGGMTRGRLKEIESGFQAGAFQVLFVQIQAGGTGLTLTRACRAVVAELPWTATALFQAIKRVHRYTQRLPVTADLLMLGGCWLEDVMLRVIQRKYREEQAFLASLT